MREIDYAQTPDVYSPEGKVKYASEFQLSIEDAEAITSSIMTGQSRMRPPGSFKSKSLQKSRFEHGRIYTTNVSEVRSLIEDGIKYVKSRGGD